MQLQILSTFCTYNVTKSIRLSKICKDSYYTFSYTRYCYSILVSKVAIIDQRQGSRVLSKAEAGSPQNIDFGLSAQTQKFETKTISFRSPVPLDKGNAGAGGDIETIGNLRTTTTAWSTTTGSKLHCTAQARLVNFVVVVSSTTPNKVESRRPAIHKLRQV